MVERSLSRLTPITSVLGEPMYEYPKAGEIGHPVVQYRYPSLPRPIEDGVEFTVTHISPRLRSDKYSVHFYRLRSRHVPWEDFLDQEMKEVLPDVTVESLRKDSGLDFLDSEDLVTDGWIDADRVEIDRECHLALFYDSLFPEPVAIVDTQTGEFTFNQKALDAK